MKYSPNQIKNVALVGGSKSGKTTLAECMMFEGKVLKRMGSVEEGNTASDYHEIEQERQNSVFSSILHTEWRGNKINIIDTPGLDDYIGEVISALRVCDTTLMTLNAQHGVEVGTEIIWRYLDQYRKPVIFVVNQMDHPKADYQQCLEQAQHHFSEKVVVMQYPYQTGDGFNAIIDLLKMVMYVFPPEGGKPEKLPIPSEEVERANELHNTLVEAAAENDESLMELYFEKGELDEDEMRKGIRIGMLKRDLFPLFCLSAKQNMGSGRLMGFIGNVAPSAGDMGPELTTTGQTIHTSDKETSLFVFKASHEKHAGALSYFKVCSGVVKSGMELVNTNENVKGKMNQLFTVDGKNRQAVDHLIAGDIGATVKLKNTHHNNTLRSKDDGIQIEAIQFPEPRIRKAIAPADQKEDEKLAMALSKLKENDPTLQVNYARELKQTIIQGQGELHLQTILRILEAQYGVKAVFDQPRISYRETIQASAEGYYKHKKQSGGSGQYGEVYLKIQPYHESATHPNNLKVKDTETHELAWGGKLVFCSCIVGGVIDQRFMPAILKGIMEVMEEGPLTGSYARDIMVYIYDGKMHPVDSNEISFKIAGAHAFKKAFMDARPKLLEPIYQVEVLVPDEYLGDIMTDLQGRRAMVEGITNEGAYQRVIARVPLAEMYRYNTSLNSISQGRATYSRKFIEFGQVPGDVQVQLMQSNQKELVLAAILIATPLLCDKCKPLLRGLNL